MKGLAMSIALTTAAILCAPVSHASGMPIGNYEFQTTWDPTHSWVWAVRCDVDLCLHISAIPRPSGGAAVWDGYAQLSNGTYTMEVDVPTGLICPGYGLPTHNTYSWDVPSLAGSVNSTYDAGCGGAPGGGFTYSFTLVRL